MTQLVVMLAVFLGMMWLMSLFTRKQQQRMAEQRERLIEEALVPGTWVRTTAGFYGKVVEADGDVVTLATPLGDETLWARRAIDRAEEPPFASVTDLEHQDEADGTQEVEEADGSDSVKVPDEHAEEAAAPGTSSSENAAAVDEHTETEATEKS